MPLICAFHHFYKRISDFCQAWSVWKVFESFQIPEELVATIAVETRLHVWEKESFGLDWDCICPESRLQYWIGREWRVGEKEKVKTVSQQWRRDCNWMLQLAGLPCSCCWKLIYNMFVQWSWARSHTQL